MLTMELRLRGDPEDGVKSPTTDGSARRLGDTPRLGVPAEARFLRPRLRLSCPWPWPLSPREPEVKGLCLLEGDCLALPAPDEMVNTLLLLASLSGSEKPVSQGSSPLLGSGTVPWAAPASRGLAASWWAGEAGPEVRGWPSRGGCCGVVLREPTATKRLLELQDSSKAADSPPGTRGAGLPPKGPVMATEPA